MLLLMPPRIPLIFFAAVAHCWPMVLLPTMAPTPYSAKLLFIWLALRLYWLVWVIGPQPVLVSVVIP